ncbi:MAG: hypothetical protein AB7S38_20635 [Vulcanimicrobiota bacterium]
MKKTLALVILAAAVLGWYSRSELETLGRGCSPIYPDSVQEAAGEDFQCFRSPDNYYTVVSHYRRYLGSEWRELHKPLIDKIFLESGIDFARNLVVREGRYEVVDPSRSGWLLSVYESRLDGMRTFITLHRYMPQVETPVGAAEPDARPERSSDCSQN